uniref:TIR domain-containing protein n=1 Tax=Fagus sylvatica TaxID=28930 RepID=A0A2N9IVR2_FAGSY
MTSMSTQKASSSSTPSWKYDVFLSFRGEDTRNNFTDHLYKALNDKGIVTFRDEEKLKKGKSISPELFKAIEESRFAIVILSRNYASSTWCLDELVKIIECMKMMKTTVLPIFYDVDPSNVRKQTGTFAQSFAEHKERFKDNIEKVQTWRATLEEVANLKGWHLLNRPESKFIQNIVGELWLKLSYGFSEDLDDLVGIISRAEKLKSRLATRSNDVCIIGVWGMGGIGSRVIITTRDKHLLHTLEVDGIYEVDGLNDDEALHLLSLKAFKKDQPPTDYLELSKDVVHYVKGLPLAIEILGSNLFEEMGKNIVHQECLEEPGKRSRLWSFEDINNVLTENTGTEAIQGMVLELLEPKEAYWRLESFSKLHHLKLLIIDSVHLSHDPKHLPNSLRIIDWSGYPSKSFPSKSFERLKSIRLRKSPKLVETLDFTKVPVLEKLVLEDCINLPGVHPSIGVHKKLKVVSLKGCKNLKSLPSKFEMESLEIFILSGCSKVKKIPEFGGNMECVRKLYLDGTAITKLPASIENLNGLDAQNLRDCQRILGNAESVEKLDVSGTAIRQVPSSIRLSFSSYPQIVIPGSEIPEWFSHQSMGPEVNIKLHYSDLCNDVMGIALCAVIGIRFEISCRDKWPPLRSSKEVKKCGVRLLYKKDIEDPIPTDSDSDSTLVTEGNKVKRRRDEYDGAGPSGEGSSNDVPHPKRIERPTEFGNSDSEESSEYKDCDEELSDVQ